jgi:FMN reductase
MRQASPKSRVDEDPITDVAPAHPPTAGAAPGNGDAAIRTILLVGHPTPGSRTLAMSTRAAESIRAALFRHGVTVTRPVLVDLSVIAPGLLCGGPDVDGAAATVAGAGLLVVASPTFKASYTGVLKTFLDLLPQNALAGTVAVPLMTAAASRHRFAVDAYLATVLAELGAVVPCRGLSLLEAEFPAPEQTFATWCDTASPVIAAVLAHRVAPPP